jgi:hypothetical protein
MVDFTAVAVLSLQVGIFALLVVAVRRRDAAASINALVSFLLSVLPTVLDVVFQAILARSVLFGQVLSLWLAVAGFLHTLGMLGLYDSIRWWDHLTHTVSAALVAAVIYALVLVTGADIPWIGSSVATVTVVSTFAVGVFWELIELIAREVGERYDIEPVLVHYGWRDTYVDLGFDVVGALLVVVFDLRVFVPVVSRFPATSRTLLVGSGLVVIGGSLAMGLFFAAMKTKERSG